MPQGGIEILSNAKTLDEKLSGEIRTLDERLSGEIILPQNMQGVFNWNGNQQMLVGGSNKIEL